MKRLFAILVLPLAFFVIFPLMALAATNYGDESYGGGNYNVGDVPNSSAGAPQCSDNVTAGTPNLFEIRTTKNAAILYFTPPAMPYSNFYIAYSRRTDIWEYGTQYNQGYSSGVLKYTINLLRPNTKYYFEIRAGNGCATGSWGNVMSATTTSSTIQQTYYKNIITVITGKISSFIKNFIPQKSIQNQTLPTTQPAIQTQPQLPIPTPSPKPKFCFLWWCF